MNPKYTPKMSAIEAKAIVDQMIITTGLKMEKLAKLHGCTCGYELMKKIAAENK